MEDVPRVKQEDQELQLQLQQLNKCAKARMLMSRHVDGLTLIYPRLLSPGHMVTLKLPPMGSSRFLCLRLNATRLGYHKRDVLSFRAFCDVVELRVIKKILNSTFRSALTKANLFPSALTLSSNLA